MSQVWAEVEPGGGPGARWAWVGRSREDRAGWVGPVWGGWGQEEAALGGRG